MRCSSNSRRYAQPAYGSDTQSSQSSTPVNCRERESCHFSRHARGKRHGLIRDVAAHPVQFTLDRQQVSRHARSMQRRHHTQNSTRELSKCGSHATSSGYARSMHPCFNDRRCRTPGIENASHAKSAGMPAVYTTAPPINASAYLANGSCSAVMPRSAGMPAA